MKFAVMIAMTLISSMPAFAYAADDVSDIIAITDANGNETEVSVSDFAQILAAQPHCHMECSSHAGCGGGHYGVCCHEVCN